MVIKVEHTIPEFCLKCYNNKLMKIEKKWEERAKVYALKAKKQGYNLSQAESLGARVREEMKKDVMKLDQKWEKMWSA